MGAKLIMGAMVAGTTAVVAFGHARVISHARPAPVHHAEVPWLSREAAAELIADGGAPGRLFADVVLGGSAPSPATRARIAEFARKNDVEIDFEVHDDELAAIRLGVTFHGGFGYEGADTFALRLERPSTGHCCMCGDDHWIDNWAYATEDGVHITAHARVNRVEVRWEKTVTAAEVVARADALLGKRVADVKKRARDRWVEITPNESFSLEVARPYPRYSWGPTRLEDNLELSAHAGIVTGVAFRLSDDYDSAEDTAANELVRTHWGRPHVTHDKDSDTDTWTWRLRDRVVTAEDPGPSTRITIASTSSGSAL